MHRKLTTATLIGLAAAVLLGASAAHAQQIRSGKKLPLLVDRMLEIRDPQALVGPNWDGQIRHAPQVRIKQKQPAGIATPRGKAKSRVGF